MARKQRQGPRFNRNCNRKSHGDAHNSRDIDDIRFASTSEVATAKESANKDETQRIPFNPSISPTEQLNMKKDDTLRSQAPPDIYANKNKMKTEKTIPCKQPSVTNAQTSNLLKIKTFLLIQNILT